MSEPTNLSLLPSPSVLMAQRHPDISERHAKFLKRQQSVIDAQMREVLEGAWLEAATATAMVAFCIALVGLFGPGIGFTLTTLPLLLGSIGLSLWHWRRRYLVPGRQWVASLGRGEREELVRAANEVIGETLEKIEAVESVSETDRAQVASGLRYQARTYFADVLSGNPKTREKGVIALFASRDSVIKSTDYDAWLTEKRLRRKKGVIELFPSQDSAFNSIDHDAWLAEKRLLKMQTKHHKHQRAVKRKKDVEAALTARPQRAATHPQT